MSNSNLLKGQVTEKAEPLQRDGRDLLSAQEEQKPQRPFEEGKLGVHSSISVKHQTRQKKTQSEWNENTEV